MASKTKEARLDQKKRLEEQLERRLAALTDRGLDSARIAKDVKVRMLRAEIRKTNARLKAISAIEKKNEEMARLRTEKAAAPKKEKGKKQKAQPQEEKISKRQQKKRQKKVKKKSTESGNQ
ncbi:MAG: hypothetical protein JRH13_07360 [Deltaproteobacteria bacterium]|nr:hypothetical protein [Deltaproteobacteria bacterium]